MNEARRVATYPDIESFYAENRVRLLSPEWDWGVWWRDLHGGIWRATWVKDTGEFFVIRGQSRIGSGPLLLLGKCTDSTVLDNALKGWADECGKPNSLQWIRERVATL